MPLNHSSAFGNLTDTQYSLIGKIVVEFANLDFLIGNLLNRLLLTPDFLGRTYTERMNVSALQDLIKNAIDIHKRRYNYKIVTEKQVNEIINLDKRISDFRGLRNTFAHYCWFRSSDTEIYGIKFSSKLPDPNKKDKDIKKVTNEELENIFNEIYLVVEKLNDLISTLPEFREDEELLKKITFKK